jgi:hypothetical protein
MVYNKQQSIPGRRDGDDGGGGLEFFSSLAVQSRLCMPI